ncbi:hypothetical protein PBY51_015376 [Eleginops maclovinus]|uniref:Uncharacterized protein n=1 Tax=Eleginops maclovinus TaxID=56733 RepID=A0AAN8AGM4_ELEMC|nr:hypothetical protein PBY51_015376 [Eleginops maclovinus]
MLSFSESALVNKICVEATMQLVFLWIAFTSSLKLCSGIELPCRVSKNGDSTTYTIQKINATGCILVLTNAKGNVLKSQVFDNENEMKQSEWTFDLKECYKQLNFSCTCISELEQNTAICTTDCNKPERQPGKKSPGKHWIPFGVICIFILVLLLLLLLLRAYISKDPIVRCCKKRVSTDSARDI